MALDAPRIAAYFTLGIWVVLALFHGLPAIAIFYLIATVESAIRYWTGRGGLWKGRVQDA
jgi:hypothetical protein